MRFFLGLIGLVVVVIASAAKKRTVANGSPSKEKGRNTVQLAFRTFLDQLNLMPDLVVTSAIKKSTKRIRMESANDLAKNLYTYKRRAELTDLHTVVIAVKQRNMEELERILYEISDPSSAKYGQHLTNEEVEELTANHESTSYVLDYLRQNDVSDIKQTHHGDYITATAPIHVFERMLSCEFHVYSAKNNENFAITRTSEYFLEEHVADHVATVFHTIHFPPTHYLDHYHKRKSLGELHPAANLAGYVTPKVLKDLYSIDITLGNSRTSQAVYESIGQTMSASDLTYFQHYFNLTVQAVSTVIGGHSSDRVCKQHPDDCVEANLDVQYMMAIAPHVPTTYYYWGGEDFMVDWLVQVAAMRTPPKVISISYGMDEQYLSISYANAFTTQAIKVGVQGVTLTASSGDDGAPGSGARANSFMCGYHPSFPASSPYVTAVGGTMGPEHGEDETACQSDHGGIITTGGGFSYLYDMPSWQKDQVESYRAAVAGSDQQPLAGFNAHGRGYPDISALAYNYVIAVGNELTAVSGTSASSPVFAGMVSLINSARMAAGHSNLGWLNPALYQLASYFAKDITSGDNRCAADAMVCCGHGFFAADGWDPVTGLGAINFPAFKDAMMSIGVPAQAPTVTPTRAPQGPTIRPTRSPALAPTVHPTAAPTMSRGWLSINQYEGESCMGSVTTVSAVPTDTCLELYGSDLKMAGSVHYVCNGDGTAKVSYFSDALCRKVTHEAAIFMGCAYKVANYYDSEEYYSTEVSCTVSSDPTTPPLPSYDGKYAVERSYNSLVGCEGHVSGVEAILQNFCFNINQRVMSYKLVFPNIVVYNALNCPTSKVVSRSPLNTDCQSALEDDDGGGDDDADDDDAFLRSAAFEEESAQGSYSPGLIKSIRPSNDLELQADDDDYAYGDDATTDMFNIWAVAHTAPEVATHVPTVRPTVRPSQRPTVRPSTHSPTTCHPSVIPTANPSQSPTAAPSNAVPVIISNDDYDFPSFSPVTNVDASGDDDAPFVPNDDNGGFHFWHPSSAPTLSPSDDTPSTEPSPRPSEHSAHPTNAPTQRTVHPTTAPSLRPTRSPSLAPSFAAPSEKPSALPSLMPISIDSSAGNISLTLQHVLSGVSMDGWRSSADKNVAVMMYAVTTALALKSSGSVVFVSASELAPMSSSKYSSSISQLLVKYKVLLDLADTSYSTVPSAMQGVQTTMAGEVAEGKFDSLLHRYAAAMQSSVLISASSQSVAVVGVDAVSSSGPDEDQDSSSPKEPGGGASATIIISLVLLVMALTVMCSTVRWSAVKKFFSRSPGQSLYSHVSLNSDSLHGSIVSRAAKNGVADEDVDVEIELSTLPTHVQPPADKAYVKDKKGNDVINPMVSDTAAV